jgi:hypothetical protein
MFAQPQALDGLSHCEPSNLYCRIVLVPIVHAGDQALVPSLGYHLTANQCDVTQDLLWLGQKGRIGAREALSFELKGVPLKESL